MAPKLSDRGLASTFASRCGALPMPDVMGRIGMPDLCSFGNPRILGAPGASSSKCISFLPFSDFLRSFLASWLNFLLALSPKPLGFFLYCISYILAYRRLETSAFSCNSPFYPSIPHLLFYQPDIPLLMDSQPGFSVPSCTVFEACPARCLLRPYII